MGKTKKAQFVDNLKQSPEMQNLEHNATMLFGDESWREQFDDADQAVRWYCDQLEE